MRTTALNKTGKTAEAALQKTGGAKAAAKASSSSTGRFRRRLKEIAMLSPMTRGEWAWNVPQSRDRAVRKH
jgi:hypothetical protein